jgi:hypothetical protein
MNKAAEQFYLEEFKKNYSAFPCGDIDPHERPDFLIRTGDRVIGVEVTEYFRDMAGTVQTPLQQREAVRRKIMNQAKSIADQRGGLSGLVFVHFDLDFYRKTSEISATATELVNVAERRFQNGEADMFIRRYEIDIPGVAGVSINKLRGLKSYWKDPLASFVPTVTPQQLQHILDQKSPLSGEYKKKCDEIWLLIVMNRFQASSYAMIPAEISHHAYVHDFDSAFLFCYERNDEQKPPYRLPSGVITDCQ